MIRRATIICGAALLFPFYAFAARDPNWPCQQIKVPQLSLASIWSGPAVNPDDAAWKNDPSVTELVQKLALRREELDRTAHSIHDFAMSGGGHRQTQLSQVLVGVFTILSQERDSVIAGLSRFGIRQKELASEIRSDNEKLRAAQADPAADPRQVQQLMQKVTWEAQVFQDRSQALSYACDVPTKIEQRLFALARQIQYEME